MDMHTRPDLTVHTAAAGRRRPLDASAEGGRRRQQAGRCPWAARHCESLRCERAVWGRCGLSSICRCRREAGQRGSLPVQPHRGPESHPLGEHPTCAVRADAAAGGQGESIGAPGR
jgi:hypothetical protein